MTPLGEDGGFFRAVEMLTQEQAVEIKVLERQGRSIRQIMRETGLSRNTVRKYLRGAKVQYGPRDVPPLFSSTVI